MKPKDTPLPKAKLFVVSTIIFSEAFAITMIFPFLAQMVLDFGITDSVTQVGYYAGWIASSFNIAQLFSSFFWGRLSDLKGRKPILLIGLLGSSISIIFFGFATTIWWAIIARSFHGLINGNVGVSKTYLAEITDDSNSAKAFSVIGLAFGVGLILGPAISGWTSNPHEKLPDVFPVGSFFHTYPYLIPCLISAFVSLSGFITGIFVMRENTKIKSNEATFNSVQKQTATDTETNIKLTNSEMEQESQIMEETGENIPLLSNQKKKESNETKIPEKRIGNWKILKEILKNKEVVVTSSLYAFLGLSTIAYDEVFSIWSVNSAEDGGINFGSADVGTYFMVSGLLLIFYQIFIFPLLVKKFQALTVFKFGMFIIAVTCILTPVAVYIATKSTVELWVYLIALTVVRMLGDTVAFTSVFMMINNSEVQSKLGAVNGFAQTFVALTRAAGPNFGSYTLSWSLNNNLGFPFNYWFFFLVDGIVSLIAFVLPFTLKASAINYKKKEEIQILQTDNNTTH